MTKKINAAYMENGLKRNWTMNDFCNDLMIEPDEFKRLLKKYFSPKVERYYQSRLSANQKHFDKTKQGSKKKDSKNEPTVETPVELNEQGSGNDVVDEVVDFKTYERKEQQLKQSIFEIEVTIKNLQEERKGKLIKVESIKKTVESLISKLKNARDDLEGVELLIDTIDNHLDEAMSKKSTLKKELEQVQQKIKELKVITIVYTADGKIKTLGFEWEIPQLAIESALSEMMEIELLEDLTLKELRIMAKIVATGQYIVKTTNREVDFKFEEISNISAAFDPLKECSTE